MIMIDVILNDESEWQLIRGQKKRWIEVCWGMFVGHVVLDDDSECQPSIRSEQKRYTEVSC